MTMQTPYYIVYEDRLRANLEKLLKVSREADLKIIMAFKANALWNSLKQPSNPSDGFSACPIP